MKVLCIVGKGFEELECVGSVATLLRAGISVDIYAIDNIEAEGRFGLTLKKLYNLQNVHLENYDALLIPGGPHFKLLESNPQVRSIIETFMKKDKVVGAICSAPTILGRMGLLNNRTYTCNTAMNSDFGGVFNDQPVVVDGNLVTGRSMAATIDFGFALIEKLAGKEVFDKIKEETYY